MNETAKRALDIVGALDFAISEERPHELVADYGEPYENYDITVALCRDAETACLMRDLLSHARALADLVNELERRIERYRTDLVDAERNAYELGRNAARSSTPPTGGDRG